MGADGHTTKPLTPKGLNLVSSTAQADLDVFPDGSMKAAQLHKDASGSHAELLRAQSRVAELDRAGQRGEPHCQLDGDHG